MTPGPDRDATRQAAGIAAGLLALVLGAAAAAWASPAAASFLWEHFAGPVAAQARLEPTATWEGTVAEVGYTPPALIGYGLVMALALAGLHALLIERLGIRADRRFFLVVTPFLAWGPLARAVQDTGLLLTPEGPAGTAYAVVEPLVYLTTAALAAGALVLDRRLDAPAPRAAAVAAFALGPGLLFLAPATAPAWAWLGPALGLGLGLATLGLLRRPGATGLGLGLAALATPLVLAAGWLLADAPPWPTPPGWEGNHAAAVPVVVGGAALLALVTVGVMRMAARVAPALRPAATAAAGFLVFGHAFDAVSTVFAIRDPLGWGLPAYGEQNPLSDLLLHIGNGTGFVVVKVLVALLAAMLVHDVAKGERGRDLAGFLLLAVFALGWGPGARNLARLAMGV